MRLISSLFFFCLVVFGVQAQEFTVMSYNVENLFDTFDDPRLNDGEYTPTGGAEWTEEKLLEKLKNLTEAIMLQSEGLLVCPDILGLQEVENFFILEVWRRKFLQDCGYGPAIIYRPNDNEPNVADIRGIKVALFSKLPLAKRPRLLLPYQGTRHILEVTLRAGEDELTVFVNHWKSRRGGGEEKRIKSAQLLRKRLEEYQQADPEHDYIVLGDFNDEPENKSLMQYLGSVLSPQQLADDPWSHGLWNTSFEWFYLPTVRRELEEYLLPEEVAQEISKLRAKRGTYYFHGDRVYNQFDQILISRGMFNRKGFRYIPGSIEVIRPAKFINKDGTPKPYRSFQGGRIGGASDHLPLLVKIEKM